MTIRKWDRKTPESTAVLAAMGAGVVTHLFGIVNLMHNYDDMPMQPKGFGTGIESGRWFLELLDRFLGWCGLNYNLPVFNGLLFLALVALAAGFAVSALRIRNRWIGACIGMLFAVFPTVTATMFFRFTAVPYGLGMLLSVLAVWCLPRHRYGLLLSGLCTALSMGIYQAYVPVTISLFLLLLIQYALEERDRKPGDILKKGLYDCAALLLGLALYFLILKGMLAATGMQLNQYRGMDSMGQLSLREIPSLLRQAYKGVLELPFGNYCGLSSTGLLKLLYFMLGVDAAVLLLAVLRGPRKSSVVVMTCLLCLIFPVAVNFIVFICPAGGIYTMMVYAFVLLPCVPLVFCEMLLGNGENAGKRWKRWLVKATGVMLSVLIFLYAYQANVNYSALYYANRQTANYLNAMVAQIRMTDGYDTQKTWVFIGNIHDPQLSFSWKEGSTYGGNTSTNGLLGSYGKLSWLGNYLGYQLPIGDDEMIHTVSQMPEVKEMPCWPDAGSIKVIDDMVVIKCQEP